METGTGQVTYAVNDFYDRVLLERAVPSFIHTRFAQVRDIPQGNTNVIKFRRYTNLTAATTPLTEGITPPGSSLSITDITATVQQYGDYVTLTDFLQMTTLDPVLTETAELLADQAGDTIDQLARNVLVAGTTVQYAGDATTRATVDAGDTPTLVDFQTAVDTLKVNKAKRITRMIDPTTGISTYPVNSCFIAFVHPDTTKVLKNLNATTAGTFVPINQYADPSKALPDEVGSIDEVRCIESTNCQIFTGAGAGGVNVYATIILGANAYGISRISGEALKNIIKPLGSAGTADPIDQRSTSGWKATFVCVRLNETWMLRYEHTVA